MTMSTIRVPVNSSARATARALQAELKLSRGDSLADRIHQVRMAAEELRHSLESRLERKAL
jgi:hypothetical protein